MFRSILVLSIVTILMMIIERTWTISSPVSPLMKYAHSTELYPGVADLWWSIDNEKGEILMEFHVNTTGWVGLGISPGMIRMFKTYVVIRYNYVLAGGMRGADIVIGWVNSTGQVTLQVKKISINRAQW